jgi:hypothetical protein
MNKYFCGNKNCWEFESNEKEYKNYKYWVIQYINEDNLSHRLDGPAWEFSNGYKEWYKNGKLHREDGPAVELPDIKYYFYNGEFIDVKTDKEFKQHFKLNIFM